MNVESLPEAERELLCVWEKARTKRNHLNRGRIHSATDACEWIASNIEAWFKQRYGQAAVEFFEKL